MSRAMGGQPACTIDELEGLLDPTVSRSGFPLEVIEKCGYVRTTSHSRVREYLSQPRERPLFIIYGEAGIGKSFLARSLQLEFLSDARQMMLRELLGLGTAGPIILPVYVNLSTYASECSSDEYNNLVSCISKSIEKEALNTLYDVYKRVIQPEEWRELLRFFEQVKNAMHISLSLTVFFSFLRLLKFKYFIILDEVSSVIGGLSKPEDIEKLRRVILDGILRTWVEALGDLLAGFMLVIHVQSMSAAKALEEEVEKTRREVGEGGIPTYGGLERFTNVIPIDKSSIMPEEEGVESWLRRIGVSNELVAEIYRDIVTKYKFRYGGMFLRLYLHYSRESPTKGTSVSGFHQEISTELEKKIPERLEEELRNRGAPKRVKTSKKDKTIGSTECDFLVENYCVDVKVLRDFSQFEDKVLEDLAGMGDKSSQYKLVYVVVSEEKPEITFKKILADAQKPLIIPVVVPELDAIYRALQDAESRINREAKTESEKTGFLTILAPQQKINLRELLLDRIARVAALQLADILAPRGKAEEKLKTTLPYDLAVLRLVEEDCKALNKRPGSDWKSAQSLSKVLGHKPRNNEDIKRAVEEVNKRIAGSGIRLEVRPSQGGRVIHIWCIEEQATKREV